jgi:hypothetical protein
MQACLAQDRVEALATCIPEEGETVITKAGPKVHPAVRDERQGRAFIVKTREKLGITSEPIKPHGEA